MNRKQLLLIFAAALVLVILAVVAGSRRKSSWQGQATGRTLLPDFPVNEVTAIEMTSPKGTVTLRRHDDSTWRVAERFDYPVGYSTLKEFMVTISEMKAAQTVKVGESQYARLQLVDPEKGDAEGSATRVVFFGKNGKKVQTLLFGKEHTKQADNSRPNPMMGMMGGGSWPDGRYVLLPDTEQVVLVSDAFSAVDPDPSRWLEKEFFKITDIKEARLSEGGQDLWAVSRDAKTADFALAGDVPDGKEVDTSKLSALKTAFSWASFNDVADPAAKPEDTGMDTPRVFTARDFDGVVTTVRIGKETADGKVHLQAEVAFDGPKERTPEADEKPEDKTRKDDEFAKALKEAQDKAEQTNRRLKGWTFVVSKYTVDGVNKSRDEFLKDKPAPAAPADTVPPAPAAAAEPK